MKKYIVLMEQEGGCDYTIGCGFAWQFVDAEDKEDVLKKVFGDVEKIVSEGEEHLDNVIVNELGGDGNPNSVSIMQVCNEIDEKTCEIYYKAVHNVIRKVNNNRKKLEKEETERKQYEELKIKFEKSK
jgi:hypothetical protein